MAFPTALKVLGPALTATAEGLQAVPELIDKDEELQQRRALRPLTLEEARLRLQKTREGLHPPHFTTYGVYEYDPATGRYGYTQSEEQRRHSAKEAEMGAIALYGTYPENSPQKKLYDAYISKMGAPGLNAQTKAALVDPTIKRWEAHAAHQKALETLARSRNDNTAAYHAKHAAYWDGLLRLRQQAIDKDPNEIQVIDRIGEMLQSNDPQQVDLAQQWLERKNVPVTREQRLTEREPLLLEKMEAQVKALLSKFDPTNPQHALEIERLTAQIQDIRSRTIERTAKGDRDVETFPKKLEELDARLTDLKTRTQERISTGQRAEDKQDLTQRTGEQKLLDLQTKSKYLDERQQAELGRIKQQAETLKTRGEAMGPYLEARLEKLWDSTEQARSRESRAAARAPEDLAIKQAQLAKLKAQAVSPANRLRIVKLEAEIRELNSRAQERGAGEVAVQTLGPQGEQTTTRYRGRDADLYRSLQGRMTGDATKDAAMVLAIPQAHSRLIAREAYQQRYGKRLPAEAESGLPAPVGSGASGATPGQLSTAETLEQIQKIGLPDPDGPGDRAVQEFLSRFKAITAAQALEGYKRLKDPEMKKAFKIAYLDFYKQRPPD